jgi:hypothetical protein
MVKMKDFSGIITFCGEIYESLTCSLFLDESSGELGSDKLRGL